MAWESVKIEYFHHFDEKMRTNWQNSNEKGRHLLDLTKKSCKSFNSMGFVKVFVKVFSKKSLSLFGKYRNAAVRILVGMH